MDVAKAKLRFLRMSPRKVRLVADLVRGMDVDQAIGQLRFSPKLAARPVRKLIESAAANATQNHEMERSLLFVQEIRVNDGPTLRRFRPRAHGRAGAIRKRSSHIYVTLAQREGKVASKKEVKVEEKKSVAKKAPAKKPATKKAAAKKTTAKKPAAKKKAPAKKPAAKKPAAG